MFVRMRETFPPRAIEYLLAAITFMWGVQLHRMGDTFSSPVFVELARIANESVWAWYCIIVGMVRLVALIINGAAPTGTPTIRAIFALFGAIFWLQVSLAFWSNANPGSTALAVYPLLCLADVYSCLRASGDAGLAKHEKMRQHRNGTVQRAT